MKSAIIEKKFNLPFEELCNSIRKNIVSNGFVLLYEINTQEIVARYGVKIRPLTHLLFFSANYIERIMNGDELAINEIPIKLVVSEKEDGTTSVSFPNLTINLSDYDLDSQIGIELLERTETILKI